MSPEQVFPPSTTRLVASGEAEIFTEATGQGPVLLLVHGWTLSHHAFDFQVADFARRFTVVTMDRRGFGQSSGAPALSREVEDIDRVIEAYGGDPVHLLGVSQGGRIALRYAAARPERVKSLVLQGAVLDGFEAPDAPGETVPLERYRELARSGKMEVMRREWLQHPLISRGTSSDGLRNLLRTILNDYRGEDLLAPEDIAPAVDVEDMLPRLSIPALIITGSLEIASRKAHASRILTLMPNAAEVVLEGAGHLSNLSHPARYNELVMGFCDATEARQQRD